MEKIYDFIVIGAGPAGLQTSYYFNKKNINYLVLERADIPGAFFREQPRHRTLISINKIYTGYNDPETQLRWDWNSLMSDDSTMRLGKYSKKYFPPADSFVQYLADFAKQFAIKIRYNSLVTKVAKKGGEFQIHLQDGSVFHARRVIVATGTFKPFIPDIPGIEITESYCDVSVDPDDFIDQKVLIIGKGNSAFETGDNLVETAQLIHLASPNPLKFAWRSHFPGHLRAINNNLLDTYQLKSQNALINGYINKIEKRDGKFDVTFSYTLANDEVEVITYDRVINCAGFRLDTDIFDTSCMPKLAIDDRFAAITSWYESQNIADLYFAGSLMQMRDFKKKQSTFIHGFRYNVRFLVDYLANRYYQQPVPCTELAICKNALSDKIIASVNQTSSLWQQTGYLCDVAIVNSEQERINYYEGVPTDFVLESDFSADHHCFVITLEFGQKRIEEFENTFAIDRIHKDDYERADLSTGIHPIVRHYHNGMMMSEHHLIEDFDSIWQEDVHVQPLEKYLKDCLMKIEQPEMVA